MLPVWIAPDEALHSSDGRDLAVAGPICATGRETAWIAGNGWWIDLPADATFQYPVSPFNPYAKDGRAPLEEAVGIVLADKRSASRPRCRWIRRGDQPAIQ